MTDPLAEDPFHEGREAAKARRRRSIAIALALCAFVIMVFAVTLARMGSNVPVQPY